MAYNRLEKLSARRIDPSLNVTQLNEIYRRISQSESVRYALGAMQPIDLEYTKATYAQGERIRNQLETNLTISCSYEYQGSVTNDTHIKAKSDIDLLALIERFFSLEPPQTPISHYSGDAISDLFELRKDCIRVLSGAFPQATIDSSGKTAISVEGGSLLRKIDVVPSNWFHTVLYTQTNSKIYKGVQVLDTETKSRIKNTPFLHNNKIEERDRITNGGLRKAVRLMKSLKYDGEVKGMTSYDITAIAYNIEPRYLLLNKGLELALVEVCSQYCTGLLNNPGLRNSILVPDGHRKVFEVGHATEEGLAHLTHEMVTLRDDIMKENTRSFAKLAEARVDY